MKAAATRMRGEGLSQREIARRLEVSPPTVQRFLAGETVSASPGFKRVEITSPDSAPIPGCAYRANVNTQIG